MNVKSENIGRILDNGVNYSNWTVIGAGSTSSDQGIHLVDSSNIEKAYLTIDALQPDSIYKLKLTIKSHNLSGNGRLIINKNLTDFNIKIPLSIGQYEINITTKSTLSDKKLWIYIFGSKSGEYADFTIDEFYKVESSSISLIDDISATVMQNENYTLPVTVMANMSDGSKKEVAAVWNPSTVDTSKPGIYEFEGTVAGYESKVRLSLNVKAADTGGLLDNGVNYSNWTVIGSGSTKGDQGIHLVNATNTEAAKLTVNGFDVSSLYELTINIKAVSTTGKVCIQSNLSGSNIEVQKVVGLQKINIRTKAEDLTNKQLEFFINGGVKSDYIDFEVICLCEGENYYVTTTPKLVMTFDDAYSSVYSRAFSYMQTKGFKGTTYAISDRIDKTGFMTKAQLDEMYAKGWCIANHTNDHTQMSSVDLETALDKIGNCQTWLRNNGYLTGLYHFAYPCGKYNDSVLQALKQLGIKTARTIIEEYNGSVITDLYKLNTLTCGGDFYNLSWVKSQIIDSITQEKTSFLMFHRIVDTEQEVGTDGMNFLYSDFQALCDWIAAQNITVMTVDEWYNSLIIKNPQSKRVTQ